MGASQRKYSPQDTSTLEIYSIIWLDHTTHNAEEVFIAQKKLRSSINCIKTFENIDQCEKYIRSASLYNRYILIIDDELARFLVPRIEQLQQVYSIYIHCANTELNHQWSEQYLKIKCVSHEFDVLVTRIQNDHKLDDSFPVDIFHPKQLTSRFIYSHLLFDCLLRMPPNDINTFLSFCKSEYKDNEAEITMILDFERNYSTNQSLLWYTRKSFAYRILHKALLVDNIDILFTMRFFLQDMYQQIQEYKCFCPIVVYHSRLMTCEDIQLIEDSVEQYISINSFLSACHDRGLALFYLYNPNDLQRVLFEIEANTQSHGEYTFGNIQMINSCEENEQILFMIGSIFRIENIYLNADDDIWIVKMRFCTENDTQINPLLHILKDQYNYGQERNIFSLGECLIKQGDVDLAKKYYQRLLIEFPTNSDYMIECYNALGKLEKDQHDYDSSLQWFHKAVKIKAEHESHFVESYNQMADIYYKRDHWKQATEMYHKAIVIQVKDSGEDHPKLASMYNNLAIAYKREKKYTEALEYHQKSLDILKKHRIDTDSAIAASHNNIGVIHRHLGHYNLALEQYQQALEIYKVSVTVSYADIANTFRNIGVVHQEKHDDQLALQNYKKSAIIYRHIFSSNHPDVLDIEEKLQYISSRLK